MEGYVHSKTSKRVPRVSTTEFLEVMKQYIHLLPNDRKMLPGPTQAIWQEISYHFSGRWKGRECKENRRNLWVLLHPEGVPENVSSSTMETTAEENSWILDNENVGDTEWETADLEQFIISISEELYKILLESDVVKYGNRNYNVLKRWRWVDKIADEFYKLYDLRCAYVFKNAKVYEDAGSIHHITISGKCKSCNNPFYGFIDQKPIVFPATLRIRTKDTCFDIKHDDVRRPVRKFKMLEVGEQAAEMGTGNWLKQEVAALKY